MSVRHSLLALLDREPTHGYALKAAFEAGTAHTWPLNVGQVYTTLARLERDGLASPAENADGQRQTWRITREGRAELVRWFQAAVVEAPPARDELAIKVLLAIAAQTEDVTAILDCQRAATMERLQDLTRQKARADPEHELGWLLLLDALVLKAEAELRWLDLCAARLAARGAR
ncbi:MAG: helix-turn-helix transcriptional regulator [Planctomycetes bacterium]|nr:helix-turn-helix transcriptional regulator [Planctomycetota bacterium]